MNVLFVTYAAIDNNSGVPLALHARELTKAGHDCSVAVPPRRGVAKPQAFSGTVVSYDEALRSPQAVFPNGRPADVVHAWTPRENVRRFTTDWLARYPAPLVVYLEDNERCIALEPLGGGDAALLCATEADLAALLPDHLPHPYRFEAFTGLADAAVVIQRNLASEVPPWVPCVEVMPGVDLAMFAPRRPSPQLRAKYGLADGERVIVYPGTLNPHTRGPMLALCRAVGMLNRGGDRCRLMRTGPFRLDFLDALEPEASRAVTDLGIIPRAALPEVLALADVLVQPGRRDAFEDLRLPGKLPEFFAMGRPVVLPDANIARLLADGEDALVTHTGTAEEIADQCRRLFADPELAARLGTAARRFAEARFDPRRQTAALLAVYEQARRTFDASAARRVWAGGSDAPAPALLARRLRGRDVDAASGLAMHRRLLDLAGHRLDVGGGDPRLLRRVLRERAHEVANLPALSGRFEMMLARLDAAIGRSPDKPLRSGKGLGQVRGVARRLRAAIHAKGGAGAMVAAAWRIAATEGWAGVRRRAEALRVSARLAQATSGATGHAEPLSAGKSRDEDRPA